jgi:hypothetical protein
MLLDPASLPVGRIVSITETLPPCPGRQVGVAELTATFLMQAWDESRAFNHQRRGSRESP